MDSMDYHRAFVEATSSTLDQQTYRIAFDVEEATIAADKRSLGGRWTAARAAEARELAAARLANWYRDTRHGNEDYNVYLLTAANPAEYAKGARAEALLALVSRHRVSYIIMHAQARVDACRVQKGGE
jgi:hypothetical protein